MSRLLQAFYDTLLVATGAGARPGETGPFITVTSPAIAVQPSLYADAYGLANPELTPKSVRALEAFSHFVDPAPKLSLVFNAGNRHSEIFQEVVFGDMPSRGAPPSFDKGSPPPPPPLAELASGITRVGEARNEDSARRLADWRAGKNSPPAAAEPAHEPAGDFALAGALNVIDHAREELERWKLMSSLGPAQFLPTFAYPPTWMKAQAADDQNLYVQLDGQSRTLGNSPFAHLLDGARTELAAVLLANGARQPAWTQLETDPNALKISFKLLRVQLLRPWFRPSLFSLRGVELPGRGPGDYSRGKLDPIDAQKLVFPFYTTEMMVAREISIRGLGDKDTHMLREAIEQKGDVRLGPFQSNVSSGVAPTLDGDRVQFDGIGVVGFSCSLVPYFPPRNED